MCWFTEILEGLQVCYLWLSKVLRLTHMIGTGSKKNMVLPTKIRWSFHFSPCFFCFFSRLVAFWRVRPNSLGAFCLNLAGGTVKGWNWMEITLLIPRSICNKSYGFVMYMCIAVQVLLLLPMVAWIIHQHACPCCSDVTSHTAPGVLVECSDVYSVCCCKTERRLDRWDLRCMFKVLTWNGGVEVFSPSCTLFQLLDFE